MGKQLNVRGGFKPLGFRSPWWNVVNHFQRRIWANKKEMEKERLSKTSKNMKVS
jgi:hypothetical protein